MSKRAKLTTKYVFQPIASRRSADFVVDAIAKAIFFCHVNIGEKLPSEQTLARQLGTNRSALREALKRMEEDGILEVRAGAAGGTFVIGRPPENYIQMFLPAAAEVHDFVEILISRRALEPQIVELAANRATVTDFQKLREILEPLKELRGKKKLTTSEVEQLSMAALQFNITLGQASHIGFLETIMQVLAQQIEPIRRIAILDNPDASIETLFVTLDALERNDVARIKEVLEQRFSHLEDAWEKSTGRRLWRDTPNFLVKTPAS
ncbi:FadR/GntR family transcriptional regulator [Pseudooceanicola sp. HF7]|uniref:FadR/GntR family transcriptional regulator n=1 Tax=Pseudooceanicola sp. HF7 TaxID=2721560 RepID=UPI001431BC14|nr:FCD domain-containing protein [Pseudooceanicola sp. HF7]NIZ10601.1 FadR family transcriptional regulator [Pseudooceanicola sp. HF7]